MRSKLLPFVITLILFIFPFFWLKPGFMDLGGDSSRLYFYDPLRYLLNYSLFAVSPSGVGSENIGFMTIPFVAFLAVAKRIFVSSTVLISAFHGLSVSMSFLFVYLSIVQLLYTATKGERLKEFAAVAGGLLYVFSPVSIFGWDKVLMTHNHVFLNPIMFYLLLRFMVSDRLYYLFCALLLTFVFSANFSFAAAPVFFAFYPITLVLLLMYKQWVLGQNIRWKQIGVACIIFILLQAFHIVPQIASMVTPGSVLYTSVFSAAGKYDRGLGYFSAIAPSIKASINVLMLPQTRELSTFLFFMIFVPFTLIVGLLRGAGEPQKYRKTLLIFCVGFLTIFFFATANIGEAGLSLYKKLFILPGFSIFRNFYGQWASAYLFYYALVFGMTLFVIINAYPKVKIWLGVFIFLLFVNAWPFINGSLTNPILWQSTNSRIAMNMDPVFVKALEYIRQLPNDGKFVTLPLTDPGYQIVAGKSEGAYQGPSMISYLAGKQDFAGTAEFGRYREILLDATANNDTTMVKRILGILNIKYIFYNSDPQVYDAFPAFPYDDVRKYLPKRQKEYKQFVDSLSLRLLESFDNRFFVYALDDKDVVPRVYVPSNVLSLSRVLNDASVPLTVLPNTIDTSVFFEEEDVELADARFYPAESQSHLLAMVKNPYPPRIMHHAFVTQSPSSFLYPLVVVKEKVKLWKFGRANYFSRIDQQSFLSAKRILELERFGESMPVLGTLRTLEDFNTVYKESRMSMNSWEATLARYYRYFDDSIKMIDTTDQSLLWKTEQRFLLTEYLRQHYRRVTLLIKNRDPIVSHRDYLEGITDMMFGNLLERTRADLSDLTVPYSASLPKKDAGPYDLYVDTSTYNVHDRLSVTINDARFQVPVNLKERWVKLGTVSHGESNPLDQGSLSLMEQQNMLTNNSRMMLESELSATDSASFAIDARYIKGAKGLVWKIDDWQPQSYYLLTFSYKTSGEPFVVRMLESQIKPEKADGTSTIVEDMLKSPTWQQYQAVVRTNTHVNTGFVQISPSTDQLSLSRIELKNVSLVHVPHPLMMVTKKIQNQDGLPPTISFVQVNPTMYKVHVTGAHGPYVLSLSEAYNRRWRVSLAASGKGIANTRHFQANGYANAWYIKPEDADGQSEYDLEVYMSMQSYFYIGASISAMALIGLLSYGMWRYIKNGVV